VPFDEYAATWMRLREIRPRTRELYTSLLANHLRPTFGDTALAKITPLAVRACRAERLAAGIGGSTLAKAYRLLKAILATAVQDELIARNPCLLSGAGSERPAKRVPPTIAETETIADAIEDRYRVLVLLGAWSGLRLDRCRDAAGDLASGIRGA
jgi:integrase